MHRVAVLMSTYNGEAFLREQVDSILAQEGVDVTLLVRDDGSGDNTLEILNTYAKSHENFKLLADENVGIGESFMRLVYEAGDEYDYYAFADQDDVWLSDKIDRAIRILGHTDKPRLYCSNQTLVDENLKTIGLRHKSVLDTSFERIVNQNKISGCTMVWNSEMQRMLLPESCHPSKELLSKRIHDVWVSMVAAVTGEIVYDKESRILYRQHENNAVGVRRISLIKLWYSKVINPSKRNGRSSLCKEIYESYQDLIKNERIKEAIRLYGYYKDSKQDRIRLMKDRELIKHSSESYIEFSLKVLCGLF